MYQYEIVSCIVMVNVCPFYSSQHHQLSGSNLIFLRIKSHDNGSKCVELITKVRYVALSIVDQYYLVRAFGTSLGHWCNRMCY